MTGQGAEKRSTTANHERFSTSCIPVNPAVLGPRIGRKPLQALLNIVPITGGDGIAQPDDGEFVPFQLGHLLRYPRLWRGGALGKQTVSHNVKGHNLGLGARNRMILNQ